MKATVKPPAQVIQGSVECPECGRHTIVELSPNIYHCINCNFERNLSEDDHEEKEGNALPILAVIGTILLILVL
ncbi:MAG: hypothetical protein VKL39_07685 [Leptolyngbyaceae bacterium]|nr:hypothetical protein [Leptolyngbyaceae bacterium]